LRAKFAMSRVTKHDPERKGVDVELEKQKKIGVAHSSSKKLSEIRWNGPTKWRGRQSAFGRKKGSERKNFFWGEVRVRGRNSKKRKG